jgi:anaerobic magnesium-protoporphyrin IX monomethyl ester cyclase
MVGGVHCNFYPESSLADFSADLAAYGESEETILEILERIGRRISSGSPASCGAAMTG